MLLMFLLWSYGTIIIASSFMITWHHCCYFFHGCGHLVPLLLSLLPPWSWSHCAIIATSFRVMVVWRHRGCCFFFHGRGHLASLLQQLLSWSWLAPSLLRLLFSHGCLAHCFFHGCGCLTPSLLSFVSWSWSPDTIANVVSFMVVVA